MTVQHFKCTTGYYPTLLGPIYLGSIDLLIFKPEGIDFLIKSYKWSCTGLRANIELCHSDAYR